MQPGRLHHEALYVKITIAQLPADGRRVRGMIGGQQRPPAAGEHEHQGDAQGDAGPTRAELFQAARAVQGV